MSKINDTTKPVLCKPYSECMLTLGLVLKRKKMPTLILKQKITKGFDHWLAAYDGAEDLRSSKYGIKTIYRGQDIEDKDTIHVVMYTPNMDVIREHMENEADLIASAGGDTNPASMSMSIASD